MRSVIADLKRNLAVLDGYVLSISAQVETLSTIVHSYAHSKNPRRVEEGVMMRIRRDRMNALLDELRAIRSKYLESLESVMEIYNPKCKNLFVRHVLKGESLESISEESGVPVEELECIVIQIIDDLEAFY